ncbi:MAG: DUF3806 domain-containing protein, partial [Hyphomicrobiales bacterium]
SFPRPRVSCCLPDAEPLFAPASEGPCDHAPSCDRAGLLVGFGCTIRNRIAMQIRPLSLDEKSALDDGLNLAARLVDGRRPLSSDQIQELYDVMLSKHADFAEGLVATGLAFGELIAGKTGFEWVRVSDEYGEETGLSLPGKQIFCAPVSMIQKRIEGAEASDIAALCDELVRTLQAQANASDQRPD